MNAKNITSIFNTQNRSVGDVLSEEGIKDCIETSAEKYGLSNFAMAYTAFGEQDCEAEKLAA